MKIQVIKTYTESFRNVFTHKLEWIKVACGPFLVGLIGPLLFSIVYGIYGNPLIIPESGKEILFNEEAIFPTLIATLISGIAFFISLISFYLNGFRYAVLGEGKNKWFTLNLNKRFIKTALCGLLYGILFAIFSIVCGFLIVGAAGGTYVLFNRAVDITLGVLLGLVGVYLFTRLCLFMIAISLDQKAPFQTSWNLMKGNVWRVFFLTFLVSITFSLLGALGRFVLGFILGYLGFLETLTFDIIVGLFSLLMWLVGWAVGTKATGLVYQALSKEK